VRAATLVAVTLTALALVAGRLSSHARAAPSASTIVDRTFLCETGYLGGIYQVQIAGSDAVPQASEARPASVGLTTIDASLAFLGKQPALEVNVERCKARRARVSLSTSRLSGGAVGKLGRSFDCVTPRRILVRVRAEFRQPTSLRVVKPYGYATLRAGGIARTASLAIQTEAGKRIALALVRGNSARIYTANTCEED
jgi:hypothetical protein